jgi:hypothetical protein
MVDAFEHEDVSAESWISTIPERGARVVEPTPAK